jgi:hypothetical protein
MFLGPYLAPAGNGYSGSIAFHPNHSPDTDTGVFADHVLQVLGYQAKLAGTRRPSGSRCKGDGPVERVHLTVRSKDGPARNRRGTERKCRRAHGMGQKRPQKGGRFDPHLQLNADLFLLLLFRHSRRKLLAARELLSTPVNY